MLKALYIRHLYIQHNTLLMLLLIVGVKSILDIGRTLEYLETLGVCVATFGSTSQFPAFFTRDSGHVSACNVEDCSEAAQLIHTTFSLGLGNGGSI